MFAKKKDSHLTGETVTYDECDLSQKQFVTKYLSKTKLQSLACTSMIRIINLGTNRSYSTFYDCPQKLSVQRIAPLIIFNTIHRIIVKATFHSIKQQKWKTRNLIDDNNSNQSQKKVSDSLPIKGNEQIVQYISSIKEQLTQINKVTKPLNISKRELELQNFILLMKNKRLEELIEISNKRLERENQKKKQSLQMLAEQLEQKNSQIEELKNNLKVYVDQSKTESNILEDELITYKKEIQNLENVREKLENQLLKAKQVVQHLEEEKKMYQNKTKKYESIEKKCMALISEYEAKLSIVEKKKVEYENQTQSYKSKLKQIASYFSHIQTAQTKNDASLIRQYSSQLKLSIIFQFMKNVSNREKFDEQQFQNIFNPQQIKLMIEYKSTWQNLNELNKFCHKIQHVKQEELSEILDKESKEHNDTIFSMFDNCGPDDEAKQIFNNKMMELQLQNFQRFQKISQLKNKIMHIRDLILNFLKALELNTDSKPETLNILNVLIQIFEYSEEEVQLIFVKKKKIFGLI